MFGLITGMRKAKKAGADYAAAMAKQQEEAAKAQAPVGDPLVGVVAVPQGFLIST